MLLKGDLMALTDCRLDLPVNVVVWSNGTGPPALYHFIPCAGQGAIPQTICY